MRIRNCEQDVWNAQKNGLLDLRSGLGNTVITLTSKRHMHNLDI